MTDDGRYELKFIMDEAGFSKSMSWMYAYTDMRKSFPPRIINSIYFDDPEYSSVRDNLAGISIREKMRLRWYHSDENSQTVVSPALEIKLRNERLNRKERLPIPDLKNELLNLEYKDLFQHIRLRLDDFRFFDDHFVPSLHVSYKRIYYEDFNGVRITFDRQIIFKNPFPHTLVSESTSASYPCIIMEVKFPPVHKIYVTSLLRTYNKSATRHSKYLVGLAAFGYVSYI